MEPKVFEGFGGKLGQRMAFAAALLLGVGFAACAIPGSPSGGPRDQIPPMIVSTWPDTFATIEPTRDPVVIRFNERISERPTQGTLESAVLVSPATGQVEVKHTREGLEIEVLGGFRAGLVYRVRLLPIVKDMFGNPMSGPFELVFSTGGAFENNVIAGVVEDRLTAEPVEGVRVEAREEGVESPPVYTAQTDEDGIFALRYVPAGVYALSIFEDVNRNQRPDFRELQGTDQGEVGAEPSRADTIVRQVSLLRPDTTPAALTRVEAQDSMVLRVALDDFLVPQASLDAVTVRLTREEGEAPQVERLVWEHELDSLRAFADSVRAEGERLARVDSLQAVADSLQGVLRGFEQAGDTLGADSVSTRLERITSLLVPPEPDEEAPLPRRGEPQPILPQQQFFALLSSPLEGDVVYRVFVSGVENINGLGNGGGETSMTWTPPEPPEGAETPPDTGTARPPDTATVAPPDTGTARPPDTAIVALRDHGPVRGTEISGPPPMEGWLSEWPSPAVEPFLAGVSSAAVWPSPTSVPSPVVTPPPEENAGRDGRPRPPPFVTGPSPASVATTPLFLPPVPRG